MATAAVALSLVLGGCGGSSTVEDPPPLPDPMPEAASGDVMLTAAQQAALLAVLPMNGDSVELQDVDADGVTRAGVTFTCDSAYPCTVTISNSAGAIVATWASEKIEGEMVTAMATGHEPPPVTDPLVQQNSANAVTVGFIMRNTLNGAADPDGADNLLNDDPTTPQVNEAADNLPQRGAYANDSMGNQTTVGGLGLGQAGPQSFDDVTLTSSLNPNATDYTPDDPTTTNMDETAGGSKMIGRVPTEDDPSGDEVTENAGTVALAKSEEVLDSWSHKVLFRDWGDTAANDDGGFETGALVYTNLMDPTEAPFNSKLASMFANTNAQGWFTLNARFDDGSTLADGNSVPISLPEKANQQTKNMMFDVGAPQLETLAVTLPTMSEHRGTYFGAAGTYKCINDKDGCGIRRAMGGDTSFGVDLPTTASKMTDWVFMPDPGATVMVPDQDWLVFGAWMTTPDVSAGTHRVGVFYDGMDPYAADNGVFGGSSGSSALHGSATYSGGAAGVYVDGTESGLFTAEANLTANFDVDGDNRGKGDTDANLTDAKDFTISGRIDNFRDSAGVYLGTDTLATPNDPVSGGENDWVVLIPSTPLVDMMGAYMGTSSAMTGPGGSADGVGWTTGEWNLQFYGAGDTARNPVAPTGAAGNFRAYTNAGGVNKGVVGAFGVEQD